MFLVNMPIPRFERLAALESPVGVKLEALIA